MTYRIKTTKEEEEPVWLTPHLRNLQPEGKRV